MTTKIECEEVTVKLPKAIMKFLKEQEGVLEERTEQYLERSIVGVVCADVEAGDVFVPSGVTLAKKYNLQPSFKKYGFYVFGADC